MESLTPVDCDPFSSLAPATDLELDSKYALSTGFGDFDEEPFYQNNDSDSEPSRKRPRPHSTHSNDSDSPHSSVCNKLLAWHTVPKDGFFFLNESMQPISCDMALDAEGYQFNTDESKFIHYRRNQLKLTCCLLSVPEHSVASYLAIAGKAEHIDTLSVSVTCVTSGLGQPKSTCTIPPLPEKIDKNVTVFSLVFKAFALPKLYFSKATAHNNSNREQQEFFHVIVTLLVQAGSTCVTTISKVSDPIIVRGNHPGKYAEQASKRMKVSDSSPTTDSPATTTPAKPPVPGKPLPPLPNSLQFPPPQPQPQSQTQPPVAESVTVFNGKVGINTDRPTEALTVAGNLAVTGAILQPSDIRVKQNIKPLDTGAQLEKISKIKMYEYQMKQGVIPDGDMPLQHGVIAQELKEIYPDCVKETAVAINLGDGEEVSNLLMVDKDALFMESVAATIEIAKRVQVLESKPPAEEPKMLKQPVKWFRKRKYVLLVITLLIVAIILLSVFVAGVSAGVVTTNNNSNGDSHKNCHATKTCSSSSAT